MKKIKIEHDGAAFIQCDDGGDYHLLLEGGSLPSRVRLTARRSSPSRDALMHAVLERRIAQMAFESFWLPDGYQVWCKPLGVLNPPPVSSSRFEFGIRRNSGGTDPDLHLDVIVAVSRTSPTYQVSWVKSWEHRGPVGLSPEWKDVLGQALAHIGAEYLPELSDFTASFDDQPYVGGPELDDEAKLQLAREQVLELVAESVKMDPELINRINKIIQDAEDTRVTPRPQGDGSGRATTLYQTLKGIMGPGHPDYPGNVSH